MTRRRPDERKTDWSGVTVKCRGSVESHYSRCMAEVMCLDGNMPQVLDGQLRVSDVDHAAQRASERAHMCYTMLRYQWGSLRRLSWGPCVWPARTQNSGRLVVWQHFTNHNSSRRRSQTTIDGFTDTYSTRYTTNMRKTTSQLFNTARYEPGKSTEIWA